MMNASDPAVLESISHLLYNSQTLNHWDGIPVTTRLQAIKQVYRHPWKQNTDFVASIQNQRDGF